MWDKLIDALVKAFATAITGGGLALLGGLGTWFGRLVLSAYGSALSLTVLDERPITGGLYGTWARGIFLRPLGQSFTIGAGAALLLLLALLAHVLFKQSLAGTRGHAVHPRLARLYIRYYFPFTIVVLLLLIAVLATVSAPFWLFAVFTLLALPVTVYAISYSRDLVRGVFWERLCYASSLVAFLVALALLPHRYGREVFDLRLRSVTDTGGVATGGDVFVFDERDTVLCAVTLAQDSLTLRLFKPLHGFSAGEHPASLRLWASEYRLSQASTPLDTNDALQRFQDTWERKLP